MPQCKSDRGLLDYLRVSLENSWSAETCWPPMRANWRVTNPAHGQCLVTALVAQREQGGSLVMGNARIPGKTDPILHFRNFIDGQEYDLTWSQFPTGTVFEPLDMTVPENSDLYKKCLDDPDTRVRYERLNKNIYLHKDGSPV